MELNIMTDDIFKKFSVIKLGDVNIKDCFPLFYI